MTSRPAERSASGADRANPRGFRLLSADGVLVIVLAAVAGLAFGTLGGWIASARSPAAEAITAWSTLALAVVTAGLVTTAIISLGQSRAVILETQTDRQLDWGPYLVREVTRDRQVVGATGHVYTAETIKNIGRGPALGARYCWYSPGKDEVRNFGTTRSFHMGLGDQQRGDELREHSAGYTARVVNAVVQTGEDPLAWIEHVLSDIVLERPESPASAFVCEDRLGNRYRFWAEPKRAKADVWVPEGGRPCPLWAQWPAVDDLK